MVFITIPIQSIVMERIIQEFAQLRDKMPRPINPYEKDRSYFLDMVRHFFGLYSYGDTAIGWGGVLNNRAVRRTFRELRNYGRGVQDVDKYKDILDPIRQSGKNKGKRLWNISWQILPIIPKFRNIIKSKFNELILNPITLAVDDEAQIERLIRKNKAKLVRAPSTQAFMQDEGYVPEETDDFAGLDNPEDVEMLFQLGGIRLAVETMFKDAIDFSFYNSGWDTIKDMVIEDFIDLNAGAVEQYNNNGVQCLRYIDPARLISDSSIYPDMRDTSFRGYMEYMKMSTLKTLAPELTPAEINQVRTRWKNAAYQTTNLFRGSGYREEYSVRRESTYSNEDFGVEVATLYWLDDEFRRFVVGRHPRGSRIFEEVPGDFSLSERGRAAGKNIEEYPATWMFKCRWVVGTDIIFDWGKVDTTTYMAINGSLSTKWPLSIYIGNEPSLVEKIISFDDDVQLANFKIRNIIAKIPPGPRMVIFKNMIRDSVKIGGETLEIPDILSGYQAEGIMILDENKEYSYPGENPQFNKDPIRFLQTGVAEELPILEARIASSVDKMRQITGVSEVLDGTSQNPDMLKSVMQGLVMASNNALRPYIDQYVNMYRLIIQYMAHRYQLMLIDGEIELGLLPISENTIRAIKLDQSILSHEWGIMVEVDTTQNRDFLLQELSKRTGIPDDGYFLIWNTIQSGDYKKAQYLLTKYTRKAMELEHQRQIELAQAASMGSAQAAQASEQAKATTIQLQHKLNMDMEILKHRLQMEAQTLTQGSELMRIEKKAEKDKETGVAVVKANQKSVPMY